MSLHAVAEKRQGIVSVEQLRELGISATVQRRMQSSGALIPVHRGVLRVPGYPVTHLQKAQAAFCLTGPAGIIGHRSGAFLRGVPIEEPAAVEVIVPRGSNLRHPGIITHQPTDRLDLRPSRIGLVPVANPLRLLLDLGASAPPAEVAIALDHFLVAGNVTIASVMAARERHRCSGRRGLGALELVLHEQRFGTKPPDSVLELAFMRLIDRFGLLGPSSTGGFGWAGSSSSPISRGRIFASSSRWTVGPTMPADSRPSRTANVT